MKEIIFGTQNKAKIDQINWALKGTETVVVGLPSNTPKLEVNENGTTAQENARKKAMAYASVLHRPVISMDNALYFEGLSDEKQPGVKVRRFRDESRQGDTEMLNFYKELLVSMNVDEADAWWEFGICLANPDGTYREVTIKSPRKFVKNGSDKMIDGYPLESIQKDPISGKIISDMSEDEQADFWLREIGSKVQDFVLEKK